ncbi:unnamed protein product [Protopolystoma xenopodis]|uniref:G-protein coupled receptors family 1 profile domain-containing protein n=1 Tax=Protopolystoma xenopodis TaxID=117903 RepID=A0A3S5C3L7_9PLAT|nr:unnamed protein product [Protopolystoma xenopodis]
MFVHCFNAVAIVIGRRFHQRLRYSISRHAARASWRPISGNSGAGVEFANFCGQSQRHGNFGHRHGDGCRDRHINAARVESGRQSGECCAGRLPRAHLRDGKCGCNLPSQRLPADGPTTGRLLDDWSWCFNGRQTNSLLTTPASISAASSCLLPTATALPTDRIGGRSVFVSRYSVTGLFLLNLSLADLLHVLVCAPCTLLSDYLLQMWPFGEFTCRLVNWAQSLVVLLCAFTHVVISFDRLAAVYWPIQRRRLLSMRSARGIVLSIWVLAAALSTPTLIVCRLVYSQDGVPTCQEVWTDVALPSVTASTSTSASTPMSTPTLEPVSSVSGASPSSRSLTRDAVLADLTSIRLANSTTSRPAHSDSTSRFNVDSGRAEWMTYLAYPTSTAANVVTSSSVVVEGAGLDQIYSLVLLLLQYIFPLVVITGTYTAIVLRIWGSSTPGELDVKRDEALNRSKKRVGNHNL